MIYYICKNCKKRWQSYPSLKRKFCSRKCKAIWQSKNVRGEKHPNFVNRIQIKCKSCGKPMFATPYYFKVKNYCSRICKHIGQSKRMSAERNPGWKGGRSEKFKRWGPEFTNPLKRKIKERDNHICQKCNLPESSGQKFIVHHKDFNPRNNSLENLQLLCLSCHMIIHNNLHK